MLTIELNTELENTLKTMAEQEHISVNEIINRLLGASLKEKQVLKDEENRQQLLKKLSVIKPVKCKYTSEQIVRSLRDGTVYYRSNAPRWNAS
jgi:hypothetical protein